MMKEKVSVLTSTASGSLFCHRAVIGKRMLVGAGLIAHPMPDLPER